MTLQAIKYDSTLGLEILDQLLLPLQSVYFRIENVEEGFSAIKKMQVRGAPAIAIVGMLSLAVEIKNLSISGKDSLQQHITERLDYLVMSRPTAVNLSRAASEVKQLAQALTKSVDETTESMRERIMKYAVDMLTKDISDNKAMGHFGAEVISKLNGGNPVNVVTICNTGSLATAGYGTALGVVRALADKSLLKECFCLETRPYNQGARLTAYELVHDKLPATLICDSMVTLLMERKDIKAVVVGADRVACNGDTANKIGTHQLAIVSKNFGVPFYVCAPFTSIDMNIKEGTDIVIEERPQDELAYIGGQRIAAPGINCWNPAFDVTPANLITGIVTEKGVIAPSNLQSAL